MFTILAIPVAAAYVLVTRDTDHWYAQRTGNVQMQERAIEEYLLYPTHQRLPSSLTLQGDLRRKIDQLAVFSLA